MSRTCQSVVSFTRYRCLALILRSAAMMIARMGYRVRGVYFYLALGSAASLGQPPFE